MISYPVSLFLKAVATRLFTEYKNYVKHVKGKLNKIYHSIVKLLLIFSLLEFVKTSRRMYV